MAKDDMGIVGCNILISTAAKYYTGKVLVETNKCLVLTDAAWIAHTVRYSKALKQSVSSGGEPYPSSVIIRKTAIIDIIEIKPLPREVKQ
jgi:hypothetical protein